MRRLRLGILGAARIARSFAAGVKDSPAVEVVAVASRDPSRARAFAAERGIGRICSYEELLADRAVDAVYIALPNRLHVPWSIAALRAGKHVLCEKPLAESEAEAREAFAAADQSGAVLLEGFPFLFQPQMLAIERLVASGAIGQVRAIVAGFGDAMSAAGDIRLDPALGGGALLDLGCYPIAFARQIVGARPTRITAIARWQDGTDRTVAATLAYPGGELAQVTCTFETGRFRRAVVAGSDGVIETEYHNHTIRSAAPGFLLRRGSDRMEEPAFVPVPREDGFRLEAEAFAALIDRRDPAALAARTAASIDNAWTLEAALSAARPI